ncbi:MAG: hypothetical protein ACHQAY_17390 [Hyphomicrobiales bacterium]
MGDSVSCRMLSAKEAKMETPAPGHRSLHSPSITVLRWLAMSIVAAPEDGRGVQYLTVRNNMAASIERFGLSGTEAKECLERNMDMIRDLVREIETTLRSEAEAA